MKAEKTTVRVALPKDLDDYARAKAVLQGVSLSDYLGRLILRDEALNAPRRSSPSARNHFLGKGV